MRSHTHREYLTWMQWLEDEWERPGIVPYYLMLVCAVLKRYIGKDFKAQPNDFKLKFTRDSKQKKSKQDPEEVTRRAKANRWGSRKR